MMMDTKLLRMHKFAKIFNIRGEYEVLMTLNRNANKTFPWYIQFETWIGPDNTFLFDTISFSLFETAKQVFNSVLQQELEQIFDDKYKRKLEKDKKDAEELKRRQLDQEQEIPWKDILPNIDNIKLN